MGRVITLRPVADDQLIRAVPEARSIAQVLKLIGLRAADGNYKTIKRHIQEIGLDTSHFKGQGWLRGTNIRVSQKIPIEELLVENSYYQSYKPKGRLLDEGIKRPICEKCGMTKWSDEPIPLELDHRNGRNNDNRLDNLRLLCPNCHAQTTNYRGKNKKLA